MSTGYMRASSRMAHQTIYDYLHGIMSGLGYFSSVASSRPYGCPLVIMADVIPDEWAETYNLTPGTVAVTLGNETPTKGQQLGDGLAKIDLPLFVDIFMGDDPTALAVSMDVRDIFTGRLPSTTRYMPVTDYSYNPSEQSDSYWLELEDVERVKIRNGWHSVRVTACMYFPDEGN